METPYQSVAEPSGPSGATSWSGRTRGGYFGNWFFIQLIRLGGLRVAYLWLRMVAAYFLLAAPSAYRCSVEYLERVLGPQPVWKRPLLVYRHFYSFGVTLLDRLAVILGRARIQHRFDGRELLQEHLACGRGVLLLAAHVGNWDVGGQFLTQLGKPVNLVVLDKEVGRVRNLFEHALKGRQFRLLTTDGHPLRSIPILAALKRGEIVALHGDRSFGGGGDLAVPFLGGEAHFPLGAYRLAAFSGAPIFPGYTIRERIGAYRFFVLPPMFISRDLRRAPSERLRAHVAEYVSGLESVVRRYPFQWYNFYPFWNPPSGEPQAVAGLGSTDSALPT